MSAIAENDSSEARIAYLRERGVEIEFPEDRAKVSPAITASLAATANTRKVSIVKIPCDSKEPMTEVMLPISDSNSSHGDQLLEILRIFFRSKSYESQDIVSELQKKTPTMFGNTVGDQPVTVSQETLRNITDQGNVEAFALTRPTEASGYCGVSLYLDEVGQLKHLPVNTRAAMIAADCGYDSVPLVGDMFIARTHTPPTSSSSSSSSSSTQPLSAKRHVDFRLTDLDSSQAWLRRAKSDNYDAAAAVGRVSMEGGGEVGGLPKGESVDSGGRVYRWRETADGVSMEVTLPLAQGVVAGSKDIVVTFRTRSLTVKTKSQGTLLLQVDPLAGACDPDDCTWTYAVTAAAAAAGTTGGNAGTADTGAGSCEVEISLLKSNAGETWGSLEKKY